MLGRHVYRVHPADGRWTSTKEGEEQARHIGRTRGGDRRGLPAGGADKPSRVMIDDGDGMILDERLFGPI